MMYYNDDSVLYFNGSYVRASEARGNLFDQSLHYGYAVFEGIRAYHTAQGVRLFKPREHFERMQYSCTAVGIPYPFDNEEVIAICYEVLSRNGLQDAYIRPLVCCPPNMSLTRARAAQLLVAAWAWPAYLGDQLLKLHTSSYRRISPASFTVDAKVSGHYVNSILATQEAKDKGFDEALMLDVNGFVAEGPGANFFLEKDGVLFTPQKGSILPGITRATLIELCEDLGISVVEKELSPEEVYAADSAFFCGTAAEVIGIASLDGKAFSKPWDRSIGAVLQKAYRHLVLEESFQPALTA